MKNPLTSSSDPVVTMSVGGESFEGFVSGRVTLTMEEMTNSFDLEWVPPDGENAPGIYEGDEIELAIDGDVLISGFVDSLDESDEPDIITYRASGRSKTGDLLECSAMHDPGTWRNAKLSKILGDVTKDFGLTVTVEGDEGDPFPKVSIDKGETVADLVLRLASKRGLVPYCVGGDLVAATAGSATTRTALKRGENIVRTARSTSVFGRFSHYTYLSQVRPAKTENGKPVKLMAAEADPGVTRYRPMLIQAESHDALDAKNRAKLERNRRAGNAETVQVVVSEWLTDEGYCWRPNTTVHVQNDVLGIDADLLVVTATYRFGANVPREVELTLRSAAAFDSEADYPQRTRGAKLL